MKQHLIASLLACALGATLHSDPTRFLKAGEIMPEGWMKEQIRLDLEEGYLPHYDAMNHSVTHELFVHQNRTSGGKYDGLQCWWSGEHEGYWKDGILRMAFLAGNDALKKQATGWLDAIVAAQGEDGYIGIYAASEKPNTRFKYEGENGELWTQSRIFQALIAGYEFTGDKKYLNAVIKAVDCTIQNDPGNYFAPKNKNFGGVSHGIGFFDILWFLHQETGQKKYAAYATELYADFNNSPVRDDDLQTQKLLGEEKFQKHGAHVAEGFFVPAFIAALTSDEKQEHAAERALEKLKYSLTPSGAMVCDENVKGRPGSGDTGYEYCGVAELVQSLGKVLAITGNPEAIELAETMALNAGQGARLPVMTALAYVSTDNRIEALSEKHQGRLAYAAYHKAAACCTLNGGRMMPYYVAAMWTRSANNLTAQLYGPCTVKTEVGGVAVKLREETSYPFEDTIRISVDPAKPLPMKLSFRIPKDAADVQVTGIAGAEKKNGCVVIERTWRPGDTFALTFDFPVKNLRSVANAKERYLKRGPLVYALPLKLEIKASEKESGINPGTGFHLYEITAKDHVGWMYTLPEKTLFSVIRKQGDPLHPFADSPIRLKGTLQSETGEAVETTLVPIGCTILRRTTFPETP